MNPSESSELLAMLAHDLRNPISTIFSYSDLILDSKLADNLTTNQKEIIGKIRKLSYRSVEMIKNYQFYLVQNESFLLKDHKTDLSGILKNLLEEIPIQFEKSAPISLNIPESIAPLSKVPPAICERVISNILHNACLYTPADGEIELTVVDTPESLTVSVRNSEPLIPEPERTEIFEPFKRGSTSGRQAGSGLGLALVSKLCQMVEAEITLQVDPRGNLFEIQFPR